MEIKLIHTGLANCYLLIEGDKAVVIDPVLDIKDLEAEGIKEVSFCLATHGHADHIAHAKILVERFGIPLTLHEDEAIYAKDDSFNLSHYVIGDSLDKVDDSKLNLISSKTVFDFLGHTIEVIHTPGHTRGSVMYLVDNSYLFSGDTIFKDAIGRTDLPGSSRSSMLQTLDRLIEIDANYEVYPGHGKSARYLDVKKSLQYWRGLV